MLSLMNLTCLFVCIIATFATLFFVGACLRAEEARVW